VTMGLAELGVYTFARLLEINAAVVVAMVLVWRGRLRYQGEAARVSASALLPLILLMLGAALFFPSSEYVMGGKDPGTYLNEGAAIARRGTLAINDPDVAVHGFSHVTGGGLAANLDRVLPRDVDVKIDRSTWRPAPIFGLIGNLGGVDQLELERTLNMGVGMVAIVANSDADRALEILRARGVNAWVAGQATAGTGRTTLLGEHH